MPEVKETWSEDAKRIIAEEKPLSLQERARNLMASMEHAVKHNAPITREMMSELRDLLGFSPDKRGK
jgi:uncharacterized protein (DUF1778 family)